MARIDLEGIAHSYANTSSRKPDWALEELTHCFEDGGAYALLGPSGCGKTTLLSLVSGLLHPTRGRIFLDGRDATGLPPRDRNIAQVFQFPIVYETMKVFDNLAFPLRNRGLGEDEIRKRAHEVAEMLELTAQLERPAGRLDAGEKQRVSLGRALVRRDVAAILLDEPLTVIDPGQRRLIRRQLREVHQQTGVTLIYVTHDQMEALTFADEVVVMDSGRVLQVGTPRDLFLHPRHRFVGHFIGSPGMNLLRCRVEGLSACVGDARIPLDPGVASRARSSRGTLELGIRPEFLELTGDTSGGALPVLIDAIDERGDHRVVHVTLAGTALRVRLDGSARLSSGAAYLRFPSEWTRLYCDGKLVS